MTETLEDLLVTGPLPPEHAARLGAELAAALARVHRSGRTHADLKPESVTIEADLRPVLRDQDLVAGGDPARDLLALGVILRAMLGPPDQVPIVLRVVVDRACATAPLSRYGAADQVGRALELWLTGRPPELADPDEEEERVPWLHRVVEPVRPLFLAVGTVLVLVSGAAVAVEGASEPRSRPREVRIPLVPTVAPPVALEVEGLVVSRADAERVLDRVATATEEELRALGLSRRAVDGIVAGRPFPSLDALAQVPGVGPRALERLVGAAGADPPR